MSLHIAAYDIGRDSSRQRVAKILLRFGRRIQESVFEIDLEPEEVDELKREIGPWLAETDLFDLYPIDRRKTRSRVRWQSEPYRESVVLL